MSQMMMMMMMMMKKKKNGRFAKREPLTKQMELGALYRNKIIILVGT